MIAVIADDFTGAAELAGISLRFGLKVKLYTGLATYEESDVCIVSSNSRSMTKEEAIDTTRAILLALQEHQPKFIFKKTDSVLRGYVADELRLQMELTGKKKAMLVPANPSLGRKIVAGKYYINDTLITETDFAADPEFPVRSADVKEMLGRSVDGISVSKRNSNTDVDVRIVIAETAGKEDVDYWVSQADENWMLAGGGDFFESLLTGMFPLIKVPDQPIRSPHLYVCGTTATSSREFIRSVHQISECVLHLSVEQLARYKASFSAGQISDIKRIVEENGKLLLAIETTLSLPALQVREAVSALVKQLCTEISFTEIFIEGGATAAAVLARLNLDSFLVINEIQRGVVRMQADDIFITVKPGSYAIPVPVRRFYLSHTTNKHS